MRNPKPSSAPHADAPDSRRLMRSVSSALACVVAMSFALPGVFGAHFATERDFFRAREDAGWREMGRYTRPLDFPARVLDVKAASGGIKFKVPGGNLHDYSGFPGKDFELYTFLPDDPEGHAFVVLMTRK